MIVRRMTIGLAMLGLGLALAQSAPAGVVGQCIGMARQTRRQCFQQCTSQFRSDFQDCFGPSSQCAETCLGADRSCRSGPLGAFDTCAIDPNNPQSCAAQLQTAVAACRTDPDPRDCAQRARLIGLECRQQCFDAQKPALDDCQAAFRMCLVGCGGESTTTTTTSPSPTTTTLQ